MYEDMTLDQALALARQQGAIPNPVMGEAVERLIMRAAQGGASVALSWTTAQHEAEVAALRQEIVELTAALHEERERAAVETDPFEGLDSALSDPS